jgi:hypothetical protein
VVEPNGRAANKAAAAAERATARMRPVARTRVFVMGESELRLRRVPAWPDVR